MIDTIAIGCGLWTHHIEKVYNIMNEFSRTILYNVYVDDDKKNFKNKVFRKNINFL